MFFTILIITITFGAETELHFRAVQFCSAADGTFVSGNGSVSLDIPLEFLSSMDLFGIHMHMISRGKPEYQEIQIQTHLKKVETLKVK